MPEIIFPSESTPTFPDSNEVVIYFDNATDGVGNPQKVVAMDAAGNKAILGGLDIRDYRLIRIVELSVGSGTYTPSDGTMALLVECQAAGGSGGGAATASSNLSLGSGAGGGAYSRVWIPTASASYAYVVGAGGAPGSAGADGNDGNDTTFAASVCIARGGKRGSALPAGTTVTIFQGGLGGDSSTGAGDVKKDGGDGGYATRLSSTVGCSGDGGDAVEGARARGVNSNTTPGNVGKKFGGGGSGAMTASTAQAGGAGADGKIRIWEFA